MDVAPAAVNALAGIPGKQPLVPHSTLFSYNYAAAALLPPLQHMEVAPAAQVPPPGTQPPPPSPSLVHILTHNSPSTKEEKARS